MSGHPAEPWEVSRHGTPDYAPQFGIYAGSRNDHAIVKGENAQADAERIVACVNYLAGVPDTELQELTRNGLAGRVLVDQAKEDEHGG